MSFISPYCSETTFIKLEQTLMHWSPPVEEMRTTYQYRMRCHKAEGGGNYYNSFWGDLQSILLSALFPDRTAKTTGKLIFLYTSFFKGISIKIR